MAHLVALDYYIIKRKPVRLERPLPLGALIAMNQGYCWKQPVYCSSIFVLWLTLLESISIFTLFKAITNLTR